MTLHKPLYSNWFIPQEYENVKIYGSVVLQQQWRIYISVQYVSLHTLPFADDSDRPSIITQGDDFLSKIANNTADQSTSERPLDFECLHSKGLNFIHLNTRSLLPKLYDLRILAANTNVAVIGITEFWLDASVTDSEIDIADYTIIRRDRNRKGGGVCIYIRSDFIFKLRDDICTTLETVWAELYLPKTKPILIGVCYRPPKHIITQIH